MFYSSVNVFRECRERVSAEAAARLYGLEFDRKGRCRCPFHYPDRHPSMSFRAGRFRCWSCGAAGDSVEFAGKLLGLEPLAAAERLNMDFALNLPFRRKPLPEDLQEAHRRTEMAQTYKAFQEWREALLSKLCAAYRIAHIALKDMENLDNLTVGEALAIREQARLEYIMDRLTYGGIDQQMEIFRKRRCVEELCKKILNSTQKRSGAA